MSPSLAITLVVLGLALLTAGGEALVRGATTVARIAGVSPAVVGLTVVAMGTSLPELVVSLLAAHRGEPDLAIGNVIGSNIFNVTATLGLTALVTVLPVHGAAVRLEWPFMFGASVAAVLAMRDGTVDRVEGAIGVVALALFIAWVVRIARRAVGRREREALEATVDDRDVPELAPGVPALPPALGFLVVGIALLVVGGRWLVDGSIGIARLAGLSERVIGLTIVAVGTGAPELATSLVAARRGRTDVAVANMIGSNIFNLLGILGLAALVAPLPVAPALLATDAWWMLGSALLILPLLRSGMRLTRLEGGLLALVYAVYVALLLR